MNFKLYNPKYYVRIFLEIQKFIETEEDHMRCTKKQSYEIKKYEAIKFDPFEAGQSECSFFTQIHPTPNLFQLVPT